MLMNEEKDVMEKTGKYIYGIIGSNRKFFLGPCGINACEMVYTIPYHDVSAVVCDSEIVDYTCLLRETLAMRLVRHQKVIEKIMSREESIIPMKLGTFAADETEVEFVLSKGYSLIKQIMEKIKNKIEIDVVVTWADFSSLLRKIGAEEEIVQFKEKMLSNPAGVTVDSRMKAGLMIKNSLDRKRAGSVSQIKDILQSVSQDVKEHDLMDDKMIMNSAFLIEKKQQAIFDKKVMELDTLFREELNFRCVGPLPPYSFYTLEIEKIGSEDIEWAKEKLGISADFTDKDKIKEAYRKTAFSCHPDRHPDEPDAGKEFDNAQRAYKILGDYCSAVEQRQQDKMCYYKEDEFNKNIIFVKIKER